MGYTRITGYLRFICRNIFLSQCVSRWYVKNSLFVSRSIFKCRLKSVLCVLRYRISGNRRPDSISENLISYSVLGSNYSTFILPWQTRNFYRFDYRSGYPVRYPVWDPDIMTVIFSSECMYISHRYIDHILTFLYQPSLYRSDFPAICGYCGYPQYPPC